MEEVLTAERTESAEKEQKCISTGSVYIMDRRAPVSDKSETVETEAPPEEPQPEPAPRALHRLSWFERRGRLYFCAIACVFGIAAGAAVACFSPMSAEELSQSLVMSDKGGFAEMLLRRMAQCTIFLLAEYIVGYFAAGGLFVWLLPVVYGLGAGLSAVGALTLGGEPLPVIFCAAYAAVLVHGANASGEFSALLLRLVSGRNGSVVTDGAAAYHFTLKFCLYLGLIFALAIIEAGIRAAN